MFSSAAPEWGQLGTWTPTLTFTTPGDLSVTYGTQYGRYIKLGGSLVLLMFNIQTSAFTHATASGSLNVGGLPFTVINTSNQSGYGAGQVRGVTKAGYTDFTFRAFTGTKVMTLVANGSGVTPGAVAAADMPSGGTVNLIGAVFHEIAE